MASVNRILLRVPTFYPLASPIHEGLAPTFLKARAGNAQLSTLIALPGSLSACSTLRLLCRRKLRSEGSGLLQEGQLLAVESRRML